MIPSPPPTPPPLPLPHHSLLAKIDALTRIVVTLQSLWSHLEHVTDTMLRLFGNVCVIPQQHPHFRDIVQSVSAKIGGSVTEVRLETVSSTSAAPLPSSSAGDPAPIAVVPVANGWFRYGQGFVRARQTCSDPAIHDHASGRQQAAQSILTLYFIGPGDIRGAFLREVIGAQDQKQRSVVRVYTARYGCMWCHYGDVPARPANTVFYNQDAHLRLARDFDAWMGRKKQDHARGRTHHRTYLLCGPPGGGKTSMVKFLATHAGWSLAVGSLRGVEDQEFASLVSSLPPNTILLLEDVDAATTEATTTRQEARGLRPYDDKNRAEPRKGVTLSTMLNTLDGPLTPDGLVVVMTTNYPERLDPALTRPGRVSLRLDLGAPDAATCVKIYTHTSGCDEETGTRIGVHLHALGSSSAEVEAIADLGPETAREAACLLNEIRTHQPTEASPCPTTRPEETSSESPDDPWPSYTPT